VLLLLVLMMLMSAEEVPLTFAQSTDKTTAVLPVVAGA
jgi:hypothetical protein